MDFVEILKIVVSILSGIAVCIPLAIKLVNAVQSAAKEKNWSSVMQLVLKLMEEAEANYKKGAEKKEYVMDSIEAVKSSLNYDVDMDKVSEFIDSICDTAKIITAKVEDVKEEKTEE